MFSPASDRHSGADQHVRSTPSRLAIEGASPSATPAKGGARMLASSHVDRGTRMPRILAVVGVAAEPVGGSRHCGDPWVPLLLAWRWLAGCDGDGRWADECRWQRDRGGRSRVTLFRSGDAWDGRVSPVSPPETAEAELRHNPLRGSSRLMFRRGTVRWWQHRPVRPSPRNP